MANVKEKTNMLVAIFLILLSFSKCCNTLNITVEQKKVETEIGGEVQLKCSANSGKVGCSFTSPLGKSFIMNSKQSADEGGRIQAVDTQKTWDCAMKITEIKQSDNGNWRCNVTCTKCDNGRYGVGVNVISVIVASEELTNVITKLEKTIEAEQLERRRFEQTLEDRFDQIDIKITNVKSQLNNKINNLENRLRRKWGHF